MGSRVSLLLSLLLLASPGFAQGTYDYFGSGCAGNGINYEAVSLNPGANNLSNQNLPNEYCYPVQTANAITVEGFRLYTRTAAAGQIAMGCALYLESATAGTPDVNPAGLGTMNVDIDEGWYTVWLGTPVSIPAGSTFWISQYDTSAVLPADLSSGTAPPARIFWRRPAGGGTAWAATGILNFPAYRIICSGSGPLVLTHIGTPTPGGPLTLTLGHALPSSGGVLYIGASDASWQGLTLPFDLTPLGAPGCSILASWDVGLNIGTDATGTSVSPFLIPNDPGIVGLSIFNQALVIDPGANAISVTFSNGGKATFQ